MPLGKNKGPIPSAQQKNNREIINFDLNSTKYLVFSDNNDIFESRLMEHTDQIIEFLRTHPLISVYGLEKELGLYEGAISHAVQGRKRLPKKHVKRITAVLARYGYIEIEGDNNLPL